MTVKTKKDKNTSPVLLKEAHQGAPLLISTNPFQSERHQAARHVVSYVPSALTFIKLSPSVKFFQFLVKEGALLSHGSANGDAVTGRRQLETCGHGGRGGRGRLALLLTSTRQNKVRDVILQISMVESMKGEIKLFRDKTRPYTLPSRRRVGRRGITIKRSLFGQRADPKPSL